MKIHSIYNNYSSQKQQSFNATLSPRLREKAVGFLSTKGHSAKEAERLIKTFENDIEEVTLNGRPAVADLTSEMDEVDTGKLSLTLPDKSEGRVMDIDIEAIASLNDLSIAIETLARNGVLQN